MSDGKRRAVGHQHVQRVPNQQLGFRIDAGSGLIENQHRRVERQRARERQQLLLADRQRRAPFRHRRVVTAGKRLDETVGVNGLAAASRTRCGVDRIVSEADIAGDRAGKEMHVLQDEPEELAKLGEIHVADVDAVDQNPAARHVVKAQQKTDQRRLPCSRGADDADPLARLHLERDIAQHIIELVAPARHLSAL